MGSKCLQKERCQNKKKFTHQNTQFLDQNKIEENGWTLKRWKNAECAIITCSSPSYAMVHSRKGCYFLWMVSIRDVYKVNNCCFLLLMPFFYLSFFNRIHPKTFRKIQKKITFVFYFLHEMSSYERKIFRVRLVCDKEIASIYYEINGTFSA